MKVYLVYARIPNKIYKSIPIQSHILTKYDHEKDEWFGIWGCSTNKKLFKKFMKFKNPKYFYGIEKSYDSIDDLKESLVNSKIYLENVELKKIDLDVGKNERMKIVLADHEYIGDDMDTSSIISEELKELKDYRFFKKEYRNALELLGYTTTYTLLNGTDEESVIADDGLSYSLTYPSGFCVENIINTLNYYIYHYGCILSLQNENQRG